MSTIHQLVSRNIKFSKRIRPLVPALKKCPQKRGVVQKIFIQTPKKPNSAKRKVAKVKLSTGRVISCYIPGIGHKLTKHSVVLVRGGRAQDLIGVRYKPIFGKFDFVAPVSRISRLSKFGLSNKQRNSVVEDDITLSNDDININKKKNRHYPSPLFSPLSMQYNVNKFRSNYKYKYFMYYYLFLKNITFKNKYRHRHKYKNINTYNYKKHKYRKKHKHKYKNKYRNKYKQKIKNKYKYNKKLKKHRKKRVKYQRSFLKYKSHFLSLHYYRKFIKHRINFTYHRRRRSYYSTNKQNNNKHLIRLILNSVSLINKVPFRTLYDKFSSDNKSRFRRIFYWLFKRYFYSLNGILSRSYHPSYSSFYNINQNQLEQDSFFYNLDELISPIVFNQKIIDDNIGYIKVRKDGKYVNIPVDVSIPSHIRHR